MQRPGWLRDHIPSLDGLRGLAIALVLLHHCEPRVRALGLGTAAAWGWAGVNLFFVLSGFLITGILLDERSGPHLFRNFYARRGLRIWPLYFLVVPLVYFGFAPGASWSGRHGWIYFLFYVQNLFPGLSGALYPTWSLAIEEQFYLIWAPLVRWLHPKLLGVLLLAVLGSGAALRLHFGGRLTPVNTLYHLDGLAAGCLLALALRWWPAGSRHWARIGWLLLVAGAAASVFAAQAAPAWLNTALAVVFAGAVLLAAVAPRAQGLGWAPLRGLGKISYGVYLIHMPLFVLLGGVDVWLDRTHAGAGGDLVIVLLRLAVTLAVATLLWYGFERPILGLKRYFRPSAGTPEASDRSIMTGP